MSQTPVLKNSTTVHFSPGALSQVLSSLPWDEGPLLSRLFTTPLRKSRPQTQPAPAVIGTVLVGGVRLRIRAKGAGPVVLFVHGWQGEASQLRALGEVVVKAGYTAVSFDMKAHGESKGSNTNLLEFMDAVQKISGLVGPVHALVAHSLGATASALALARGLQVQGALLIAPMPSFDFALSEFQKMLKLTDAQREATALATELRLGLTRSEADLAALSRPEAPHLLIHDEDDLRVVAAHSRFLSEAWGAPLLVTRGLGHSRLLSAPEVLDAAATFVDRLPRATLTGLESHLATAPELRL